MVALNLNGHSLFSPSSSEMWLNCPASLLANMKIRQMQGDSGSEAAAEGTVAHEIAEIWLKTGEKPIQRLGEIHEVNGYSVEVTEEMLAYVAEYVAWCNNQEGDKHVEVRVNFGNLLPVSGQGGTADHVCCSDGKLTITDLKYGMGVKVEAENNTQLQMYALGVLNDYDWLYGFKTVEMRICQPRLNHFSTWEIPVEQLHEFRERIQRQAKLCLQDDAPHNPSASTCRWCKAKAECPALARELETMMTDDEDLDENVTERIDNGDFLSKVRQLDNLNIEQIEIIYSKIKMAKQFFDTVEEKLLDFAMKGGKMQSHKLVVGRKTRKWADEAATEEFLSKSGLDIDEYRPRGFITPAQAEKVFKVRGLDGLDDLIENRDGAPTLAPKSDKRKEFEPTASIFSEE